MSHLLRLISGYDKRNPTRTFTIANSSSTANVHLRESGFSPGFGVEKVQWSGQTPRQDGQKRISSSVDNAEMDITYNLNGGSAAELTYLQREINRFFLETRMYEEDRQSSPIWLESRWQDGLDDVTAPVYGQMSYYIRVLWGWAGKWPKDLPIVAGNIEGVVARLICAPHWEGLQQLLATTTGQIEMTPHGLLVPAPVTNLIPNPSFGHATWNTGWTASLSTLEALRETRPDFCRSLGSAARLVNRGLGANFTVTLTLTAAVYYISCYVRKQDGTAPTALDMKLVGQGAAQTTTFTQVDGGPWYLAYASFTGVAAASTHGIQVFADKTIFIDDVQLALRDATLLFPSPFCAGNLIGCAWAGTAHNSSSSRPDPQFELTMTNELSGEFTVAGWIVPHWTSGTGGGSLTIWQYLFDNDNYVDLLFNLTTNVFTARKNLAGVSGTVVSGAQTIAYNDKIHVAVTQTSTTLSLYINGVSVGTPLAKEPYLPQNGGFSIGRDTFISSAPSSSAVDGWHVWKPPFTAAQVLSLYTVELEIKSRTGGSIIGMPPYLWNKDGDGIIDAVNDTNRDNYFVVGGIPGDVEALTEWRIQPPTTTPPRTYWLGRKATDKNFDAALLYLEFQGTVDANRSGGEYETLTSAAEMIFAKTITANLEIFQGRYQYIGLFFVSTNSVEFVPRYSFLAAGAAGLSIGDELAVPTNANFILRDFGEMTITYPRERQAPPALSVSVAATPTTGSATIRADFIQLLPYPCCRVQSLDASVAFSAGDLLTISGLDAYVRRTSDDSHRYTFEHRGQVVDVVPNKYNTIYFIPGEIATQFDVAFDTGTFTVLITPRWTLPGGLVA